MSNNPRGTLTPLTWQQRESTNQLVNTLDVSLKVDENGDVILDEYEFHSILAANDILTPVDVVMSLFHAADKDGDGLLSLAEFGHFLLSPSSSSSSSGRSQKRSNFFKSICLDIDWWTSVIYVVAGSLHFVCAWPEAFGASQSAVEDLYLAGATLFLLSASVFFIKTPVNSYRTEKSFEKSKKRLRTALESRALAHSTRLMPINDETEKEEGGGGEDPVDVYIREVIFAGRRRSQITRTDLGSVLLKNIGSYNVAVLDKMHSSVVNHQNDDNHGGATVDVNDFQSYVKRIDLEYSLTKRLKKVVLGLMVNYTWIFNLTFVSGSIVSVLDKTIKKGGDGEGGLWANDSFTTSMYVAWADVVGMLYFSSERVVYLRRRHEMRKKVRATLKNWLAKGSELERNQNEQKLLRISMQGNDLFNTRGLARLLEEEAIFIPMFQVDALFKAIDTNNDGILTKEEVTAFLLRVERRNNFIAVLQSAVKDIIFRGNNIWTVGCIAYLLPIYYAGGEGDDFAVICYQVS